MAGYVDIHAHGRELSLDTALAVGDEELRRASLDQHGTDLLIRTPEDASTIEQLIFQLRARRYRVTLVAPERSRQFQQEPERLEALSERGVLLALDAWSLLRPHPVAARGLAQRLCRGGHAHALALAADSDEGDPERIAPARARAAAAALVGEPRARWLVCDAPAAIVAGEPLPPMPDVEPAPRASASVATGTANANANANADEGAQDREMPAGRLALSARLSRALLLVPLIAVAIASFVIVRAQHGSGDTILTAQRSAQRLTAGAVALVVRAAPDPKSAKDAIRAGCTPLGTGDLKNPWRCRLRYANGDFLQYRVTISGDGSYVGTHQVILAPGPRRASGGSISGCCIETP